MNDTTVMDVQPTKQEQQTGDPLVDYGKGMIDGVLPKIDPRFGSLTPEAKTFLAQEYAARWMMEADNDNTKAQEIARQATRQLMVPSVGRMINTDWHPYRDQFRICLDDMNSRFIRDGKFNDQAFADASILNIMQLPDPADPKHNFYMESLNFCQLMAMGESLGWYNTDNKAGVDWLVSNATEYTSPIYMTPEFKLASLGVTEDDRRIIAEIQRSTIDKAVRLFHDKISPEGYTKSRTGDALDQINSNRSAFDAMAKGLPKLPSK